MKKIKVCEMSISIEEKYGTMIHFDSIEIDKPLIYFWRNSRIVATMYTADFKHNLRFINKNVYRMEV